MSVWAHDFVRLSGKRGLSPIRKLNGNKGQAMGFAVNTFNIFTDYMRAQQTPLVRHLHVAILTLVRMISSAS